MSEQPQGLTHELVVEADGEVISGTAPAGDDDDGEGSG